MKDYVASSIVSHKICRKISRTEDYMGLTAMSYPLLNGAETAWCHLLFSGRRKYGLGHLATLHVTIDR